MKRLFISPYVILCVLWLNTSFLFAQGHKLIIQKRLITQTDGLPSRIVNCGIQDKYGFMWFGTANGLCYYDGTQIKLLTKNNGLRGTSILSLATDDSLGLIVSYLEPGSSGTRDTLVDVVNIRTKEVKPFREYYPKVPFNTQEIDQIVYIKGKPLRILAQGNHTASWVYRRSAGFLQEPLKGVSIQVKTTARTAEAAHAIQALTESLLLEKDSTILTFKRCINAVIYPPKGYLISHQNLDTKVRTPFLLDFNGNLLPIDSAGAAAKDFVRYQNAEWSPHYDHENMIISPANDYDVALLETATHDNLFYIPAQKPIKLFNTWQNIKVRSYFKDKLGAWWICTSGGLYRFTIQEKVFQNLLTRNATRPAFNNSTRGIYVDDSVACFNLFDTPVIILQGDTITPPVSENFAAARIGNTLWLGNYGLTEFNLRTRTLRQHIVETGGETWSVFVVTPQHLLLGRTEGLYAYYPPLDSVAAVDCGGFPTPHFVYKIIRTSPQELMAAAENGIYILNNQGTVVDFFSSHATTTSHQLPFSGVRDIYQDAHDVYWIASSHDGLFKWRRNSRRFEQFGFEAGFLSNMLCCIQEDNHANLWISTDYGLARFNKITEKAFMYTQTDGLAENEFNRSASFKDAHGRLYFGGMNGVTSFDPDVLLADEQTAAYDFPLTGFVCVNSSSSTLEDRTDEVLDYGKITLTDPIRLFTVYFSLLDYEDRPHRYACKIEGLDQDWSYVDAGHIQFGKLPYGEYILRIKAQMANGRWSPDELTIGIVMKTPFYKTWWFLLGTGLLLVASLFFIIRIRLQVLRRKNMKLEQTVNKRTLELQNSLNEQKALLQEIHHRVKNNLQFIEAIITMQIKVSKNISNQLALRDVTRRINALTLVHDMLYHKDRLETISVKDYLHELTEKLSSMANRRTAPVKFTLDIADIYFNINHCMAIGMITTELINNCFKYAFVNIPAPTIQLKLTKPDPNGTVHYTLHDNGIGLDKKHPTQGLGMRLIDIFSRQLKGKYKFENQQGLFFTFDFIYREPKKDTLKPLPAV